LDLNDVVGLLKYWIVLLYTPITNSLAHFNGELRFNHSAYALLKTYIPTISAFESLIESTLFGGNFFSFLGKTVWSNRASEEESLKLRDSIIKFNRLNFAGASWNPDLKLIQGSEDLLDYFLSKYRINTAAYVRDSYQILYEIGQEQCYKVKAKILWDSYFKHIWTRYQNDFKFSSSDSFDYSIERINASTRVFINRDFISFSDAFSLIFAIDKLDRKIGNCWKVPYLLCYQKLLNDGAIKQNLENAMLDYAINNIEYIHEVGSRDRFFKQTEHHYIKLCLCPNVQNLFSLATNTKHKKVYVPRTKYSQIELNMFCIGLNYFAGRKLLIRRITDSKQLGFSRLYDPNSQRKTRNNGQLLHLWNKLQSNGQIKIEANTGIIYHISSSVEACTPVEGVNYSDEEEVEINNFSSRADSKKKPTLLNREFEPDKNQQIEFSTPQRNDFQNSENNSQFSDLTIENHEKDIENHSETIIEKLNRVIESTGIIFARQHANVLYKLPYIHSDLFPLNWSETYGSLISKNIRDYKKWNELRDKLIAEKLIGTKDFKRNGKTIIRYFRLFKIASDEN